jgi:purine-binding chemotaxis protein CheW
MVKLVAVAIGEKRVGLLASVVVEVVRAVAISALPKAPQIIEGVINVRGTLVPVLDVRRRFGVPARPVTPDQHLAIARAGARTVALRVDRALDLVEVDESVIAAADRVAPGAEYVAGIARLPDGLLVIHDLEGFLGLDEAAGVDAAVRGSGHDSPSAPVGSGA